MRRVPPARAGKAALQLCAGPVSSGVHQDQPVLRKQAREEFAESAAVRFFRPVAFDQVLREQVAALLVSNSAASCTRGSICAPSGIRPTGRPVSATSGNSKRTSFPWSNHVA